MEIGRLEKTATLFNICFEIGAHVVYYPSRYEEELAEDIMKILTCYSARFYGRRGGRKKKNTAENETDESNGI
jgi:predicted site-specific integrase-resolvase